MVVPHRDSGSDVGGILDRGRDGSVESSASSCELFHLELGGLCGCEGVLGNNSKVDDGVGGTMVSADKETSYRLTWG